MGVQEDDNGFWLACRFWNAFIRNFTMVWFRYCLQGTHWPWCFGNLYTHYADFSVWFKPIEYARISGAFMAIGGLGWFTATIPLAFLTEHFSWLEDIGHSAGPCHNHSFCSYMVYRFRQSCPKRILNYNKRQYRYRGASKQPVSQSVGCAEGEIFLAYCHLVHLPGGALFGFFGLGLVPILSILMVFQNKLPGISSPWLLFCHDSC